MKSFEIDGVRIDKAFIETNREMVIQLRDTSLSIGRMDYALPLSYTVAILQKVADEMETADAGAREEGA